MANLIPTKETSRHVMPKTVFKRDREVVPEQLVKALTDVMHATLPLESPNTRSRQPKPGRCWLMPR